MAGASVDEPVTKSVLVGQVVAGGDKFGGGGVAGRAGGVADQGPGQVAAAGGGRGHWSFASVVAARTAVVSAMVLRVV